MASMTARRIGQRRSPLWCCVLASIVALAACGAPDYAFDATIRSDARCDRCPDAGVCLDLAADPQNCGGCNVVCPTPDNALPVCAARRCSFVCSGDYADCNADPRDGCEVHVVDSVSHCGRCDVYCSTPVPHTIPGCVNSQCRTNCSPGFGDCNHDLVTDGCEADLSTSMAHCGACGVPCVAPTNGSAMCTGLTCHVTCNPNFMDCDIDRTTPCETNTATSTMHCGFCNNPCATGQVCRAGVCGA